MRGFATRRFALAAALAALLLPPPPGPAPVAAQEPGLPPEIAARVEGCAAVAVGRRRVTAAGCPGVGVVMIRLAPGAPDLPCHARAGRARTAPRRCLTPPAAAPPAGNPVPGFGPPQPRQTRPAPPGRAEGPAPAPTSPRDCHPAYVPNPDGSCVPDRGPGDVLNCEDIDWGEFRLVDVAVDPYGLDGSGEYDGITCNGRRD